MLILKFLFKDRLNKGFPTKNPSAFSIQQKLKLIHNIIVYSRWPLNAFRYNEKIGYEMTPSFSAKMLDSSFHIKSHMFGYRIPMFQDQRSFQKGGILSVGCSFTYGDRVEAEETFTFQTAKLLGLPAYNYGVPSYSYVSCLLQLIDLHKRKVLDKLNPSILLLGAGKWMERRSASPFYPTNVLQFGYAYLGKEKNQIVIKQPNEVYSLKHLFEFRKKYFPEGERTTEFTAWRRHLIIVDLLPRIKKALEDKENFSPEVTPYEIYNFIIPRMYQIASSHNMKFVILWMPGRDRADPSPELKRVLSSYNDIILVNSTPVIKNLPISVAYTEDRHPSAVAHRIFAQMLASAIKEQLKNISGF
jgi:hypothetical protein